MYFVLLMYNLKLQFSYYQRHTMKILYTDQFHLESHIMRITLIEHYLSSIYL